MTLPLALTDDQLSVILAAAANVPQNFRNRFVENVADRLFPGTAVTDEQVIEAVRYVADRLHVNVEVTQ